MPAVSDCAQSAVATEKIPNEANELSSPLRACIACGASVLKVVLTRPYSSSSDHNKSPRAVCDTDFDAAPLWKSSGLRAPKLLFPLTDLRPELTSPRRSLRRRGRALHSMGSATQLNVVAAD